MKTRYMVKFEFRNELGEWKDDYLSNNGNGFTLKEAKEIVCQLEREYISNVKIEVFTR